MAVISARSLAPARAPDSMVLATMSGMAPDAAEARGSVWSDYRLLGGLLVAAIAVMLLALAR